MEVNKKSSLFHLFFIPFFPFGIYTELKCIVCNLSLSRSEMDAELKAFYRPYIKRSLPPFWYFSGPIIIAIIILTAKYYGMKEQDKIRERIVQLEEGRIFDIKTDLGTYSTFKALKIEGDSVLLIYNLYSADYESGLEMIKEEENYKGVSQTVHRDQLLEWFDNGIIFHVHW